MQQETRYKIQAVFKPKYGKEYKLGWGFKHKGNAMLKYDDITNHPEKYSKDKLIKINFETKEITIL